MIKQIAIVSFEDKSRNYHFYTYLTDLVYGDILIVNTVHGHQLAKFISYDNNSYFHGSRPTQWVVSKREERQSIEDIVDIPTQETGWTEEEMAHINANHDDTGEPREQEAPHF